MDGEREIKCNPGFVKIEGNEGSNIAALFGRGTLLTAVGDWLGCQMLQILPVKQAYDLDTAQSAYKGTPEFEVSKNNIADGPSIILLFENAKGLDTLIEQLQKLRAKFE